MAIESRANQVAGVAYAMVVMSSVAILLRIYCRAWLIKSFALDDWLAVIAQVLFIVFCSYEITGVTYGTGRHVADIPQEDVPKAMQMWWTCEPLYVLTNMAIKASIAIFLLRICVHRYHKAIIWAVTAVTEIYSLAFFLLFVLQCRPTELFWLRVTANPPEGQCLDATVVSKAFYAYSAISCFGDWTFSLLPIHLVWNLQMNRSTKISVVVILAAGVIASSATIVRFPYLHTLTDIDDFLYSTSDVAIWSTVETGIGITASAFATLRPLLRAIFQGSSAPGHGTSAGAAQWGKASEILPNGGYIRGNSTKGDEVFELRQKSGGRMGVTTIINHDDEDAKGYKEESSSDASGSIKQGEDWNSSQSNLAEGAQPVQRAQLGSAWNITVKKTVVQTRGGDAV